MGRLQDRVALITGGASGMGAETVRRCVFEGARVVVADLLDEDAKELVEELGDAAVYAHTDVASEEDVAAAVDLAVGTWGRLDFLFNNAGFGGIDGIFEQIAVEDYDRTMDVLVKGPFLGIKHAAPVMKRQRSGSIVNTASVAGLRNGFGPHVYSIAKAAVVQLSRCAAAELGEWGVRVNAICPGGIVTPIFARQLGLEGDDAVRVHELMTEVLAQGQPIKRPGQPGDVAAAALWLASDESAFVTGHALVVDGGLLVGPDHSAGIERWNLLAEALGIEKREVVKPE